MVHGNLLIVTWHLIKRRYVIVSECTNKTARDSVVLSWLLGRIYLFLRHLPCDFQTVKYLILHDFLA